MTPGVDFTHVIMTRFNMPSPGRESQIRAKPGWLAGRFDLFERYCLPSIVAQTSRDFHWIIYFDRETPPEFRARIEACRAIFPFIPYYCDYFSADGWPRSLDETLAERTPYLLTTRFDSDDALSIDHVERLQAAISRFAPTGRQSFNFTNGVVIERGKVYAHEHLSNAFASWFEPWDETTRTAMSIRHMHMARYGTIAQVDGPAAWLQVVHDDNVSNKVRGTRARPDIVAGRFPPEVPGTLKPSSDTEIALENLVLTPMRAARDTLLGKLRGYAKIRVAGPTAATTPPG